MRNLEPTQKIPRRAISLPGLLLIVLLVGASSASASIGLVRETATTVTSSLPDPVGSVVAPKPAPPPSAPPVRIELPPTPEVNLPSPKPPQVNLPPPKVSADPPAVTPPPTSSRAGGEVATDVATELADSATRSVPADVTREAGAVTRQAGTRPPDSPAAASPPGGSVRSVEPRRPAPPRHWLTRVWPAVSLGPFGGLLTDLPAGPEGATLPLLSGSEVSRLLLGLTASTTTGDDPGTASGLSSASPADTRGIPLPGGGEIPFFVVIAFAAVVMALLMGAVRRELGALYRWWPH